MRVFLPTLTYAPTSGHDDSEFDHFYQKLQETIDQTPKKDFLVLQEDWKVGKDAQADWGEVCGPYCNVETNEQYVPSISKNSLVDLIDQLPHPFMLVGDFNGHAENDLCLLNEKQPTYLHPPTGNYYAIDLSLCHPNIYLDFDWSVCDDLHGSDHFPILIKETESSDDEQQCRWNLKKANWETFTTLCQERLTPEKFKTAEDMSAQHYTTFQKSVFRNPRQG